MTTQTDKLTRVNEIRARLGLRPMTQRRLDREEATLARLKAKTERCCRAFANGDA